MLEFLNSMYVCMPNNIFFIVILVFLCMKVSGIGPWIGLVYVVSLCYLAKNQNPAGFDCILLRALFVHNSGI